MQASDGQNALPEFSIHSAVSSRVLSLSLLRPEFLRVEVKSPDITATADIWLDTDVEGLNRFFQDLGATDRPWQGVRAWGSMEGDFFLSATCSALGAVTFAVELRGLQGAPEAWQIQAGLVVELGQLVGIAKRAQRFFCGSFSSKEIPSRSS